MSNSVNNQPNFQVPDSDFQIEEIEQIIAPDISGNDLPEPGKITTSIVTVCQCN